MPSNAPVESGNRVWTAGAWTTVGELARRFAKAWGSAGRPAPVAVLSSSSAALLGAAAHLASSHVPGALLYDDETGRRAAERLRHAGHAVFDVANGAVQGPVASSTTPPNAPPPNDRVTLTTSGTTGEPKLVPHTWSSLRTWSPASVGEPRRWLVTYRPGSYAWFQMATLGLFAPGHAVVVADSLEPRTLFHAAQAAQANAVSATPTFWRWLLMSVDADELLQLPLQQISLGGERVDQAILDEVRRRFPAARLTHIYASTEAGACLVVHDGREGFPEEWLGRPLAGGRVVAQVQDGTLRLRSAHGGIAGVDGWIDTGDLVERRAGRVLILGRAAGAFVNVGGQRAVLPDLEAALMAHPDVAWARVYGRKAPVVGTLLAADVVLRPGGTAGDQELAAHMRRQVPESLVPRFFKFRQAIPVTANQKSALADP